MLEFSIGDNQYRAGKLDAFKQLHVSRRVAPIIPTLIPVFVKISQDGSMAKDMSGLAALLGPFADGLANMSDESSEYVISTCLSVVHRQASGGNWAPVWNKGAKACMFDDMDLGDLIQIAIKVIADSLGPFIQGLLTSQASSPE
jgi:hypothetical protein